MECYYAFKEKTEYCLNCRRRFKCNIPTSPIFLLRHNGKRVEECLESDLVPSWIYSDDIEEEFASEEEVKNLENKINRVINGGNYGK